MKPIRGDQDQLGRLDDAQVVLADMADRSKAPNLNDAQRAGLRRIHVLVADMAEAAYSYAEAGR